MRRSRLLALLPLLVLAAACSPVFVNAQPPNSPSVPQSHFVQVCGTSLCLDGQRWRIDGATAYGTYGDPDQEVALAKEAGLNTLEIVEFEHQYHTLSDTMSDATWQTVDAVIAAAGRGGLHVVLNLSSYGQSLMAAGQKPTTTDWRPYLRYVVNRVNTQTGVRYGDDPTIAMIELYGEIDAPNYNVALRGTTAQTTAFFARTLRELKALDPNHVISTGGFSYINDPNSGIDWKKIVADPNNATCDVEVNSFHDRDISVPELSDYCRQLGKPWFLSAWSSCYGDKWSSVDSNDWPDDASMASHAQDMYEWASGQATTSPGPAMPAVGTDFWNLGDEPIHNGTCDIGPQFPQTFAVVRQNGS